MRDTNTGMEGNVEGVNRSASKDTSVESDEMKQTIIIVASSLPG